MSSLPSEERASMLVMAASCEDLRLDPPGPCVAMVARDMMGEVAGFEIGSEGMK